MIVVVIGIFLTVTAFLAGFLLAAVCAAGAEAERHHEWVCWCEERCGKREECPEWNDGTDD